MKDISFRKSNAYCRHCTKNCTKKMVILPGNWSGGRYYLCQPCAIHLRNELINLNLIDDIIKNEQITEDLSGI